MQTFRFSLVRVLLAEGERVYHLYCSQPKEDNALHAVCIENTSAPKSQSTIVVVLCRNEKIKSYSPKTAPGPINEPPSSITLAAACKFKLSAGPSLSSQCHVWVDGRSQCPSQARSAGGRKRRDKSPRLRSRLALCPGEPFFSRRPVEAVTRDRIREVPERGVFLGS